MAWYDNLFGGGDPRWTTPKAIPQRTDLQMGMRGTPQPDPMNSYFTQLADPRYRKAMQQQNLFSNLLNFGAQMKAAGAPSLDPGYAGRTGAGAWAGLGQGLMSGNQDYRNQMMNAIKLKSMMDTSKRAQAMHAVDLKTKQAALEEKRRWAKQWPTQAAAVPQITPDPLGDIADTYSGVGVSGGTQVSPPKIGQVPEQFKALGITPGQWAAIGKLPRELGQKMLVNLVKGASGKFGAPTVVVDPESSTGFSKIQINEQGETRKIGEAADPMAAFRPYQPTTAQPSTAQPPTAQPSTVKLGSFGVPLSEGDPYAGVDRTTASKMMVQERNKFNQNLEKKRIALASQEKMLERLNRFNQLMDAGMGTGLEKAGPLGGAWGWDEQTSEGKAIQNELTPLMRQGLPGAASNRDVAMFAGATVGIGKPEQTNRNIIKAVEIRTKVYQDKLNFEQDYFAQNKHTLGMDAAWQAYLEANKIFDPEAPMGEYKLNQNRKGYKEWFANPTDSQSSPPETFPGTQEEWDALSSDQKAKF
jgi:hypothetical protein